MGEDEGSTSAAAVTVVGDVLYVNSALCPLELHCKQWLRCIYCTYEASKTANKESTDAMHVLQDSNALAEQVLAIMAFKSMHIPPIAIKLTNGEWDSLKTLYASLTATKKT